MSVYNREVLAAYRECGSLTCFIMGRIDAPDAVPMGGIANRVIEAPSGEIEFSVTHVPREELKANG